jgi:uncharacterized protein
MIRKLTESDHNVVMNFLSDEPSINLFIIGDIEAFGYETDFQELWGKFDDNGCIHAVLLRFHNSFILYWKEEQEAVAPFAAIMKAYNAQIFLSGKSEIVETFEGIDGLTLGKKQVTYFAECTSAEQIVETELEVAVATLKDIDRIIELRSAIEEFPHNPHARSIMVQSLESGTGRTYFLEENGRVVASASSAAENSISAMIVGVCSHKEYRRKGYATNVMKKLFRDVSGEGKVLCLFYDNPEAGRIYKRLGFKDIGFWTMYR